MTKAGWVGISLSEEWAAWIDKYIENNRHGLKSRAQVIEFALTLLKEEQRDPPATKQDLEKLRNELRALSGLPPVKRRD